MTRTSITDLKARLSAFLDIVRHGEEVIVTDRGRPIARISPVSGSLREHSRREQLIRDGRLSPPSAPLPKTFWKQRRPADSRGRSLAAILEERGEGL